MNETTRQRALATGLRLTTTPMPKASVSAAKNQKSGLNMALFLRVPLMHEPGPDAAELVQFLFVMNHLGARGSGDRVILAQEDRLLRADLFAQPAKNAARHVDVEALGEFLDFGELA